jgi:DNA repair exonuclease SbcCD nuclease subunit
MAKRKIGVMADTHIGYKGNASAHGAFGDLKTDLTNEAGMNIRTQDVNDAFSQSIDIFIKEGVDFVCHAGDGMNYWGYRHPFYSNFYMSEIKRLTKENIFYFEIAGNHNFAKKSGVGCDLLKVDLLDNTKAVYKGFYESIDLPGTNVTLHGLPSSFNKEIFIDELEKVEKKDNRFNVLVTHCGITTIEHYAKSESSIVLHLDDLKKKNMNLTLIGDYHKFVDFGDHIYYPGATERFSFTEVNESPRVLIFEIDDETGEIEMKEIFLNVRPMIDLPVIDAEKKSIPEIQNEIISSLKNPALTDAIVRLRIINLPKTSKHKHLLYSEEIIELQEKCLIFKLDFKNRVELSSAIQMDVELDFDNIFTSFDSFVSQLPEHPDLKKEDILKYGQKYLSEIDNES